MTGVGGASPGPALTPVEAPGRGPSRWVALGLMAAALVALVGISLVAQPGGGPGPQAAVDGPTATPVATPSPTAPPSPPPGTPPPRVAIDVGRVATCPLGSTPDTPGTIDQVRPPQDSPTALAFDRRAGRLVALVGVDDGVETWTFDVCTNTWTRMHPSREPFGWVQLVYDVDSDVTIGVADCVNCVLEPTGTVWVYDREANTWNEAGAAPTGVTDLFYDPISGLVVALGDEFDPYSSRKEPWSFDVETDTWTPIDQATGPEWGVSAYDASVDRIIAYIGGTETWLFDIRMGTWSRSGAETPRVWGWGMWGAPPAIAYDEATERTVVSGQGRLAAYDAATDRWETLWVGPSEGGTCGTRPECRETPQIVYDPVNERLVAYGGTVSLSADPGWVNPDDMLAFDTRTREWTVLLEASEGQATPP